MEHAEQLLAEAEVKAMILPPLITSIRVWEQLLADAEVKAIAADQLRRLQEERLWECPICHNWFSLDDATRVCTRSHICKCPNMPRICGASGTSNLCGGWPQLANFPKQQKPLSVYFNRRKRRVRKAA